MANAFETDLSNEFSMAADVPDILGDMSRLPTDDGASFLFEELEGDLDHDVPNAEPMAALVGTPTEQLPRSVLPPHMAGVSMSRSLGPLLARSSRFGRGRGGGAAAAAETPETPVPEMPTGTAPSPAMATPGPSVPHSPNNAGAEGFPVAASAPATPERWQPKKARNRAPWSAAETGEFRTALQQFGTNLTLITMMFPGRTRDDVSAKFRMERKRNPQETAQLLAPASALPIDVEDFTERTHEWSRHNLMAEAAPLSEEEQRIMSELGHMPPPAAAGAAAAAAAPLGEAKIEDESTTVAPGGAAAAAAPAADEGWGVAVDFELDDDAPLVQQLIDEAEDNVPFAKRARDAEKAEKKRRKEERKETKAMPATPVALAPPDAVRDPIAVAEAEGDIGLGDIDIGDGW